MKTSMNDNRNIQFYIGKTERSNIMLALNSSFLTKYGKGEVLTLKKVFETTLLIPKREDICFVKYSESSYSTGR